MVGEAGFRDLPMVTCWQVAQAGSYSCLTRTLSSSLLFGTDPEAFTAGRRQHRSWPGPRWGEGVLWLEDREYAKSWSEHGWAFRNWGGASLAAQL